MHPGPSLAQQEQRLLQSLRMGVVQLLDQLLRQLVSDGGGVHKSLGWWFDVWVGLVSP